MSAHSRTEPGWVTGGARWRKSRWRLRVLRLWRGVESNFSSSLTRRIVTLNLGGLIVLVAGFLWLNNFRADIIAARSQSLSTQAGIIAAAIAASAAVDTDPTIVIDPDKLLDLAPREGAGVTNREDESPEFSINPERIGP